MFIALFIFLFPTLAFAQTPSTPLAPSTLIVTAGMTLSWRDNSGNELCFPVEVKAPGAVAYVPITCVPRNVLTYVDARYIPGQYCYRVKAINDAGDSAYSNEACITYTSTVPNAPLLTTQKGQGYNIITWTPLPNALTVHISRRISPDGAWAPWDDAFNQLGLYHDHRVADGVVYCYRAQGSNYAGDSANSNEACAQ